MAASGALLPMAASDKEGLHPVPNRLP